MDATHELIIEQAQKADFPEIIGIQKKAFRSEVGSYQNFKIQPLTQSLEEMETECEERIVLKAIVDGQIVGSILQMFLRMFVWLTNLLFYPNFRKKASAKSCLTKLKPISPKSKVLSFELEPLVNLTSGFIPKTVYQIVGQSMVEGGVEAVVMEKIVQP